MLVAVYYQTYCIGLIQLVLLAYQYCILSALVASQWVGPNYYYYYRVLRENIDNNDNVVSQSTAASSASCKRSRPPSNLVKGQELMMCDIVWISPQSHSSLSVKPHFLWHALQWP